MRAIQGEEEGNQVVFVRGDVSGIMYSSFIQEG